MKNITRILFGLFFIALAVVLALNITGIANLWSYFGDLWPVVIILVGVLSWLNNPRQFVGPVIIIAVGVLFQLSALNIIDWSVFALIGPAILLFIGVRLLVPDAMRMKPATSDEHTIESFTAFSALEKKITSQAFTGGNVTAVFGGFSFDLREAKMSKDARIHVFAMFGGGDLTVPANCDVDVDIVPLFGGAEDKSGNASTDGERQKLRVTGTVIFGGLEIKS